MLLRATGIEVSFGGNAVLKGVDLELRQGECVLLTGENGAGKTSLINVLTGHLEPDAGEIHYTISDEARTFHFPRSRWAELNPWSQFRPEFAARAGVGRSWQDVRLFGSLTLQDNLAIAATTAKGESPLSAFFCRHQPATISEGVLAELGLSGREGSSADKVSLGQSKRVAIARAIAAGAKVLFLDEPLAGLDVQGVDDVLAYLKRLIDQHQVTLVIVEHVFNQHHLLPLITTRWALEDGLCLRHRNETAEREPLTTETGNREPWITALAGEDARIVDEALPRDAMLTRIRLQPDTKKETLNVLHINNLVVHMGARPVLGLGDDGESCPLNLKIHSGEIVVLQAPNGWGKTTLFRAVASLIEPTAGSVTIRSSDSEAEQCSRTGVALCVPSAGSLFPGLSLQAAAAVAGKALPDRFRDHRHRQCATLSGGERQRLALALGTSKYLNLYDEPLNGLDDWQEFVCSCREQAQHGQAVLILVPKK